MKDFKSSLISTELSVKVSVSVIRGSASRSRITLDLL